VNAEEIRAVYERFARTYDRGQWIVEGLFLKRFRRRLLSRIRCEGGCQVLEVGIGTGINLPYYSPSCVIFGVDLSRPMLERSMARAHRLGRQLTVETMDGEALAFPNHTFNAVVSTLTLCTTPDPLRLLKEISRVCRPDGRVLLLEHGLSTAKTVNWMLTRLAPGHLDRCACHLTRDVAALPEQAGLRIVHTERHLLGVFALIEASPRPMGGAG
jgi:ubiquinone/menaquinone biosynthesis C-methylase UbiE